MTELDQTARFVLKYRPADTLRWLVPGLNPDLRIARWLDTEMVAFPGEPRRRCDTVAELVSASGQSPPWALVLEVEGEKRANIVARLLEYLARLMRKLRHGPHHRDQYQLAAVLLVLTGRQKAVRVLMRLPDTRIGLTWKPRVVSFARISAAKTLARIGQGEAGRSVLPWVPLMEGAGDPAVVQEWVRQNAAEPHPPARAEFAAAAKVFAEKAGNLPAWKDALEGWNVWESQVIKEWKERASREGRAEGREQGLAEGRAEGRAEAQLETQCANLLKLLRARFQAELPQDLVQLIEQTTDLGLLTAWYDAALIAPALDTFRQGMQPPVNGEGT